MKLALFADIHSNLEAITACLAHADALGAERYAFLGDLVGYGADPVAVLDLIEDHAAKGAIVVLGNHDATTVGRPADPLNASAQRPSSGRRRKSARGIARFSPGCPSPYGKATPVRPRERRRSGAVDLHHRPRGSGTQHARRRSRIHLLRPRARAESLLHERRWTAAVVPAGAGNADPDGKHRQWLAIVGSAGQPRDRNNAACYALADFDRERITWYRVPYDHGRAAEKIRSAGLPERHARRLERGT